MTNLKSLFTAIAFTLITTATFANNGPTEILQELRSEIADELNRIDVSNLDQAKLSLDVRFLVNDDNEVIVLTTNDKEYDGVIKALLNYKKLETEGIQKNTVITLPVTLKKN